MILFAPYRPLAAFAAPAMPKAQYWRTVLGALAIVALYMGWILALIFYIRLRLGGVLGLGVFVALMQGTSPGGMLFVLFSFTGLLLAPIIVTRLIHGRSALTLIGPRRRATEHFLIVAGTSLILVFLLLPFSLGECDCAAGVSFGTFLAYLPVALLLILVQTGAEELTFRGYLQQQLAVRMATPFVWALIPAALFSFGHYAPSVYGANALLVCFWAFGFGLAAADLTARTGTIGAALGMHFANNIAAFLMIGMRGEMDGLALWTRAIDFSSPQAMRPLLAVDLAFLCVAWLAARFVLRR